MTRAPAGAADLVDATGNHDAFDDRFPTQRPASPSTRLLFADEPTGNLDSTTSAEVLEHLRRSVRELGRRS